MKYVQIKIRQENYTHEVTYVWMNAFYYHKEEEEEKKERRIQTT